MKPFYLVVHDLDGNPFWINPNQITHFDSGIDDGRYYTLAQMSNGIELKIFGHPEDLLKKIEENY